MGFSSTSRIPTWIVVIIALVAAVAAPTAAFGDAPTPAEGRSSDGLRQARAQGIATFEGRTIDLQQGWQGATTCLVYDGGRTTECFRSATEADRAQQRVDRDQANASSDSAHTEAARASGDGSERRIAAYGSRSCSSWLSLSAGTYDTGRTLRFRDRGYIQDLADYGFANATSSYTTGACTVTLYDGSWHRYPGDTSAWTDANWMRSGWDNRVRWIYIH